MSDPADRYAGIADRAEARAKQIVERAEALFPTHGRRDEEISPDDQRRDYLLAQSTPDGMRMKLREWRQKYGLKRAIQEFVAWDKKFRD